MRKIIAITLVFFILGGSLSFGVTFQDARNTIAYQQMLIDYQGMHWQIKSAQAAERSMERLFDAFPMMSMFGRGPSLQDRFTYLNIRETTVASAKYGETVLKKNLEMLEGTMFLSLRELYSGLLMMQGSYDRALRKLDLAESAYNNAMLQYELGSISLSGLQEANIAFQEANKKVLQEEQALSDLRSSFDNFFKNPPVNVSIDSEKPLHIIDKSYEDYLQMTLERNNEVEILSAELSLNLLKQEVHLSDGQRYMTLDSVKDAYARLLVEEDQLRLKLIQKEEELAHELKKLLREIEQMKGSMETLENVLIEQRERVNEFSLLVTQGLMKQVDYDEFMLVVMELEDQLDLVIYQYNTLQHKLNLMMNNGYL